MALCKSIIFLICAVSAFLLAAPDAFAERRLALVIGNSNYAIGPLENPANDADLIAEVLTQTGFEVTHYADLGYRDLQRAVVGFSRQLADAGEDTVGMVYYAGHAVQANGENYLIPVDAEIVDTLDLEIQTLESSTLMASLEKAGNRLNIVILDACRNNPFKAISRSSARGLAKIEAPFGTLLAFSTAPGDVASDGDGRNSPYTAALARAMQEPGLPVEQVFKQVRIAVMERTGNGQIPWESSSLTGDFYFVPPAPVSAAPAVIDTSNQDIEYWKSVAGSNDPAQLQSYLSAYPNGIFRDLAQQRVDSLSADADSKANENAARSRWDAVKDSGDIALLQSVAERYPSTVYAELAQVKIQSLQQQTQVAAVNPAQDQGTERLFWESIQHSQSRADYQSYLDQFPNGVFASIARNRAANGYNPTQVASLPPTAPQSSPGSASTLTAPRSSPLDGEWELKWQTVLGFEYFSMCRNGETGTTIVSVRSGSFDSRLKTNNNRSNAVNGTIAGNGFKVWVIGDGRGGRVSGELSMDGAEMTGTATDRQGRCIGKITMRKVSN